MEGAQDKALCRMKFTDHQKESQETNDIDTNIATMKTAMKSQRQQQRNVKRVALIENEEQRMVQGEKWRTTWNMHRGATNEKQKRHWQKWEMIEGNWTCPHQFPKEQKHLKPNELQPSSTKSFRGNRRQRKLSEENTKKGVSEETKIEMSFKDNRNNKRVSEEMKVADVQIQRVSTMIELQNWLLTLPMTDFGRRMEVSKIFGILQLKQTGSCRKFEFAVENKSWRTTALHLKKIFGERNKNFSRRNQLIECAKWISGRMLEWVFNHCQSQHCHCQQIWFARAEIRAQAPTTIRSQSTSANKRQRWAQEPTSDGKWQRTPSSMKNTIIMCVISQNRTMGLEF